MLDKIKKIRELMGAGVVEIKKALEETGGNEEKAIGILRKSGRQKAEKKLEREAKEGLVVSYIHSNGKVGAIIKLHCETDFVARNEEFQMLAKDIAMHVTAMNPRYLKSEDVPLEAVEKEKGTWISQLEREKKPRGMWDKILSGKEEKFRREISLLTQPFVKKPELTVGELITEKIGKIGENIEVGEFCRVEI